MPTRQAGGFRKRPITHIGCVGDPAPEFCLDAAGCRAVISNISIDGENYLLSTTGTIGGYVRVTVETEGAETTTWQPLGDPIELPTLLFVNGVTITLEVSNDVEEEKFVCDSVTITVQEYTDDEFEGVEETYNLDSTFTLAACTGTETFTVLETDADDTDITGSSITITDDETESQTVILHKCNGAVQAILVLNTVEAEVLDGLRLSYTPGNLPANNLAAWNAFFDLPANGTAFTSLATVGDEVTLIGGAGITLKASLFKTSATLLKIEDDVDCVVAVAGGKNAGAISLCPALTTLAINGAITIGEEGLYGNVSLNTLSATSCTTMGKMACSYNTLLATFSLPALTSAGEGCFTNSPLMNFFDGVSAPVCPLLATIGVSCFAFNTATPAFILIPVTNIPQSVFSNCSCSVISIPSCTNLGGTVGYNGVFFSCTNLTTVYCPTALATIDGGNPDGDLVYAVGTLGATITYV